MFHWILGFVFSGIGGISLSTALGVPPENVPTTQAVVDAFEGDFRGVVVDGERSFPVTPEARYVWRLESQAGPRLAGAVCQWLHSHYTDLRPPEPQEDETALRAPDTGQLADETEARVLNWLKDSRKVLGDQWQQLLAALLSRASEGALRTSALKYAVEEVEGGQMAPVTGLLEVVRSSTPAIPDLEKKLAIRSLLDLVRQIKVGIPARKSILSEVRELARLSGPEAGEAVMALGNLLQGQAKLDFLRSVSIGKEYPTLAQAGALRLFQEQARTGRGDLPSEWRAIAREAYQAAPKGLFASDFQKLAENGCPTRLIHIE